MKKKYLLSLLMALCMSAALTAPSVPNEEIRWRHAAQLFPKHEKSWKVGLKIGILGSSPLLFFTIPAIVAMIKGPADFYLAILTYSLVAYYVATAGMIAIISTAFHHFICKIKKDRQSLNKILKTKRSELIEMLPTKIVSIIDEYRDTKRISTRKSKVLAKRIRQAIQAHNKKLLANKIANN